MTSSTVVSAREKLRIFRLSAVALPTEAKTPCVRRLNSARLGGSNFRSMRSTALEMTCMRLPKSWTIPVVINPSAASLAISWSERPAMSASTSSGVWYGGWSGGNDDFMALVFREADPRGQPRNRKRAFYRIGGEAIGQ
ncbi:MAG: hypothetical protein WDM86_07520 [Rhizomicrobium sp.]